MASYVALLRAVNVGGTGKLAMSELRALCEACDFRQVQTYIASGNVVFDADGPAAQVQAALENRLQRHVGKAVGVLVRSAAEMAAVLAANPFSACAPNLVHVIFLGGAPPSDLLAGASGHTTEDMAAGLREIYVHYPAGQGASKLRFPAAKAGTARNINTVVKLAELAGSR